MAARQSAVLCSSAGCSRGICPLSLVSLSVSAGHHCWCTVSRCGQFIIIIIIAFQGAIRDFLQSPHSAANCLQHVRSSDPGAIVCKSRATHRCLSRASVMLRATWYEGTAQLLSLTELKSHLFELYFIGWTIKPMKEGRKPEYLEKAPGDELPHQFCTMCSFRKFCCMKHWWFHEPIMNNV